MKQFYMWAGVFLTAIGTLSLMLMFSGCAGTVIPTEIVAQQPSYDGKVQNSGIIVSMPGGFYITPERQAAYNALIAIYGNQFTPVLKANAGISMVGPNIFIDTEHDIDQKMMQTWKNSGTHQPQTLVQKAGL